MDFAYSPHRDTGGTLYLPSPTHHAYPAHFSSSLQQLRRSLSRSPSKPSRFHLRMGKTDAPGSPISPLATSRAFSPKTLKQTSPIAAYTESPFGSQAPQTTKKSKFAVRRTLGDRIRSSPRNRNTTTPKSPRRALVESATDRANASPFVSRPLFGEENMPVRKNSIDSWDQEDNARFDIDDQPIKFEFARSQPAPSTTPAASRFAPPQPSPLKRRDGTSGFESTSCATPNPKRRSLHAGLPNDFNVFEQTPVPKHHTEESYTPQEPEPFNLFSTPAANVNTASLFSTPATNMNTASLFTTSAPNMNSPARRNTSIRRAFSQRTPAGSPRPKPSMDGEFMKPGLAASKTRPQRASMDGFNFSSPVSGDSIFGRSTTQPSMRGGASNPQRHPLATTVTASASSSVAGDSPIAMPVPPTPNPRNPFTQSLPLGAMRPQEASDDSFGTPLPYRPAEPSIFARSTGGLLSKKSRDVESPKADKYQLPETPSKRHSFPPPCGAESPLSQSFRTSFRDKIQQQQQPVFGTPNSHTSKLSFSSMFGNPDTVSQRRGSHVSVDGLDDDASVSPTANRMTDSQSSVDDMPPTPTKNGDSYGRRSGRSSLRRSTFKRPVTRGSIGSDTFTAPEASTTPRIETAPLFRHSISGTTPHTPIGNESSIVPDPSKLSISGHRPGTLHFGSSFGSDCSNSFPPMTPTTPREHSSLFSRNHTAIPIGLPKNDVDESLAARFGHVEVLEGAKGEFSQMFKVNKPLNRGASSPFSTSSLCSVVKKTKKPMTGPLDRKKKLQEVEVLMALRGNDHVVAYKDHWEYDQHLYIETEYCDNGNLKDFLTKGRLDDFRIWKILLDLSLGLKFIHDNNFIHLDLKPANILIDFGGWLKIADFGLATPWPAQKGIDGEGDRAYLSPEALQGHFDKPADVFALGLIMSEIAGDCDMPQFGDSWQKLRSGEFSVLPSLSWSTQSTLSRDENGDPVESAAQAFVDSTGYLTQELQDEVAKAPQFMTDEHDPNSMDQVARAMIMYDAAERPSAEAVSMAFGCQWVAQRRSAGATIYEGNFGPSEDTLCGYEPMITDNADAMDMS
ncbi:mitosis inhibitor protein kinase swe1 [Paraconiothyrium brasiliense]|uniref:Mitosis inhibitor protein kinase swe1 n=1 Tax=Paraconiothyrium brasiliense TaxID=300254 RepID=A0ABR3QY91_9PLEO